MVSQPAARSICVSLAPAKAKPYDAQMIDSIDPRVLAANLRVKWGQGAPVEALVRLARASADGDHAAAFRWEQVFNLLMMPDPQERSAKTV